MAVLVEDLEAEAAAQRERKGIKPLGVTAILTQNLGICQARTCA